MYFNIYDLRVYFLGGRYTSAMDSKPLLPIRGWIHMEATTMESTQDGHEAKRGRQNTCYETSITSVHQDRMEHQRYTNTRQEKNYRS